MVKTRKKYKNPKYHWFNGYSSRNRTWALCWLKCYYIKNALSQNWRFCFDCMCQDFNRHLGPNILKNYNIVYKNICKESNFRSIIFSGLQQHSKLHLFNVYIICSKSWKIFTLKQSIFVNETNYIIYTTMKTMNLICCRLLSTLLSSSAMVYPSKC